MWSSFEPLPFHAVADKPAKVSPVKPYVSSRVGALAPQGSASTLISRASSRASHASSRRVLASASSRRLRVAKLRSIDILDLVEQLNEDVVDVGGRKLVAVQSRK